MCIHAFVFLNFVILNYLSKGQISIPEMGNSISAGIAILCFSSSQTHGSRTELKNFQLHNFMDKQNNLKCWSAY